MLHLLLHTLEESWLMLPILYITYLVIEHFERKESNDDFLFKHLQKYGPLFGAIVGLIPQCGFSIIAAMLYISRYITLGTLISVFIATSDEAIPVLIAHPHLLKEMIGMIIIKLIVAIVVGYIVDRVIFPKQKLISLEDIEEVDDEEYEDEGSTNACPCCYVEYPIYVSAFLRSLKIYFFIFIVTLGLNFLLHDTGENIISNLLTQNRFLQVFLASLVGFIPNCVTSVVLTQLYVASQISYGALISGLITNAGLGIVALIRYQATKKEIAQVITILLITALITGMGYVFLFVG